MVVLEDGLVDFEDNCYIENICVVYLINYIDNIVVLLKVVYLNIIIFLIVDVFGVILLILKLNKD